MLLFIMNGISPFLSMIVLVLSMMRACAAFLSLHFVTVLLFIIVAPLLCMLSVYVNFALVNIFLRFGGCL